MENLRYNLINGRVTSIGYNDNFNTLADGTEPFFINWEDAFKWQKIGDSWQLIKPQRKQRLKEVFVEMPQRAGYDRKLYLDRMPDLNISDGYIVTHYTVEHYKNGVWQYDNLIQDKSLELVADNSTIIQTPFGPMPEFNYLVYVFDNPTLFFEVVKQEMRMRVADGTVDKKLTY